MEYPETMITAEKLEDTAQRIMDLSETVSTYDEDLDDIQIRLQFYIDELTRLKEQISSIRVPKNLHGARQHSAPEKPI